MESKGRKVFVAVSGLSGRGKTTLVNALIERFPVEFARPLSFTTRPQRAGEGNEEYSFISKRELFSLYDEGGLANLDHVFENYYGISLKNLQEVWASGRIAIKELHHANIPKIEKHAEVTIRVTIIGESLGDGPGRRNDMAARSIDHIDDHDIMDSDIVVQSNDIRKDLSRLLEFVRISILSTAMYYDDYPRPSEIDSVSKEGYSKAIAEFTDDLRPTTKTFHEATRGHWERAIVRLEPRASCLEIGVGNGWLRSLSGWPEVSYTGADIIPSPLLSLRDPIDRIVSCSARNLPFEVSSFDYVLGSLIEGCLYPQALAEIRRVLKQTGLLILSAPSLEWAELVRAVECMQKTSFELKSDEIAEVYSFALSSHGLRSLLEACGYKVLSIESLGLLDFQYSRPLSRALDAVYQLAEKGVNIPIVHFVTASPE